MQERWMADRAMLYRFMKAPFGLDPKGVAGLDRSIRWLGQKMGQTFSRGAAR